MQPSDVFFNATGRLRSGWRLAVFVVLYFIGTSLLWGVAFTIASLSGRAESFFESNWGYIVQAFILFTPALIAGWGCGAVLEGLPLKALGWALHQGWLRDFLWGSLIGAFSLVLAVAFAMTAKGFRFSFNARGMLLASLTTLLVSGLVFVLAAAAEEVVFRGYPLQTFTRARIAWVGVILTSIMFAQVHKGNPNLDTPGVYPQLAFANTALAGVWLAVAYLRTRSLWLPLGIHWAWNWAMGSVLGLPVSGITTLAPNPLLKAADNGPSWLTGGAYGIEGGVACTLALLASTIFIWRTKLFSPTEEMRALTSQEMPKEAEKLRIFEER